MVPGVAFAVLAGLLALALMRRGRALLAREAEIERLQERVWTLAESAERYRGLVEAGTTAIVQRDAGGRITFANEGFAGLVGRPLMALLGSRIRPAVVEAGAASVGPDAARLVDEAVRPADGGEPRWFAWIETPVRGRDGAPEILRTGRDVTDRVAAARNLEEARGRAEAASVAKSRFLATVSHEFRTPLNGILGMAALLVETPLSPEQAAYVRAVEMSGGALLSLIDEILDFSKIEAGRVDLAAEPFDVGALVEGAVELLAPRAQDKGIEIAGLVGAQVPRRLVGDAERVRQVLINLAGNAVKFTEAGGVGVSVEADDDGIVLVVADTGPGIPAERLPQLFEEFEQGDGSASRRHEGTGLGLAITRRLVARMGGAIEATSIVGEGSTFQVRLPLPAAEALEPCPIALRRDTALSFYSDAPPDALPGAEPVATSAGSALVAPIPPACGPRRVLVVARSPFEAPFLRRRLAEAGIEALAAEDPEQAAALMNGMDAVIADRGLGDAAVREVAAAARRAGIARSLVLLSPFDRRDFGAPQDAGFDDYLVKPVRARSLFARLAPAPAPAIPVPQPRARGAAVAAGTRVLLAEDNEINALLARRALERLGAAVVWAKDGLSAVEHARTSLAGEPFDLVLMDVRMPGLDGHEAVRRIRTLEGGASLRIVALTANALAEDEAAARAAGFDGFLPKPLDLKALPALLAPPTAAAA